MRRRAYERRMRRQEVHLIGIRNEIRGALGGEPIEDPYGSSTVEQDTSKSEQARRMALKGMDMEDTEEMAPEEAAKEFNP
jgi:hypothetical protein